MKITAIKSYPAWSVWRNVFLVKIETDEGIYGWGEGGTAWRELGMEGVNRPLQPVHDRQRPYAGWSSLAGDVSLGIF